MALRALQYGLAGIDCLYGVLLVVHYAHGLRAGGPWPELPLLLICLSVLPAGALALRSPMVAGLLQFACAFLGRELLQNWPNPGLRLCAALSMSWCLAMLVVVVFRGIVEVTLEAYGEAEHQDDRHAAEVETGELKAAAAGGARNQLWF